MSLNFLLTAALILSIIFALLIAISYLVTDMVDECLDSFRIKIISYKHKPEK